MEQKRRGSKVGPKVRRYGEGGKEGNMEMKVDGPLPHEEQQDLIFGGLEYGPVCAFWEFVIPRRMVSDVDSCICIVLASRFS